MAAARDLASFLDGANRTLAACHRARAEMSLAVFDCSDLLEVRQIYGARVGFQLLDMLRGRLVLAAGPGGLVACTGPGLFSVAMRLPPAGARQAIHRALGTPAHLELNVDRHEIVLLPNYLLAPAEPGDSLCDRHESLVHSLTQARDQEKLRLLNMRRQRERHCRSAPEKSAHDVGSP